MLADIIMWKVLWKAPYIIYNEQYKKYYLFVSYDSLFENYNIRVGRSESITDTMLTLMETGLQT